jgi:transcriptional regulator with XRE-family HTH domain
MPISSKNSSYVDGGLIRQDREKKDLKRTALVERGNRSFSLSTLKRAEERKDKISIETLKGIAIALEQPYSRYLLTRREEIPDKEYVLKMAGLWTVFYVEAELTGGPFVTMEKATINQKSKTFSGKYECLTYKREYNFALEGTVSYKTISGTYFVPERLSSIGRGVFQLLSLREGDWLEGYCTWHDYDSTKIECSKNIWIREGAAYPEILAREAQELMNIELSVLSHRRNKYVSN